MKNFIFIIVCITTLSCGHNNNTIVSREDIRMKEYLQLSEQKKCEVWKITANNLKQ